MKFGTRLFKILVTVTALIGALLCCSFTLSENTELRALHPETALYKAPSYESEIIYSIPQNAVLTAEESNPSVEDGINWYKVSYGDKIGYIPESFLYASPKKNDYNVALIKATAPEIGEKIKILSVNNENGTVIGEVTDGTKLRRIISDVDYGDFYEISYEGKRAFVKISDTTTRLTLYQRTAIICACSFVGLLIIVLTFLYLKNTNVTKKNKVK